ncbi:MAG TPA: DNA polymerase I [Fibrobacteria bacterium]|nr:DNA polymerase I [Fibrobacteria bacterium]
MPSLYLIDVSALAYRSFFAFIKQPLRIKSGPREGQETSALFGFAQHTLRLLAECRPDYIAFVKDLKGPTKRHEQYAEYKAQRKPMPDGLVSQLPLIDEFVEKSGLRTISLAGYEADDVMATLATHACARGWNSYIVTRDKDMMQLVNDCIFLFELGKAGEASQVIGAAEVKEKWGVGPERIRDLLSLMGDSSDNVPGVAGIGPKGAVELIETYGSLEGVLKNAGSIAKKGVREKILAHETDARMSMELVTLHCDLELPLKLEDLACPGVNADALKTFFLEYELKSLLKLVPAANGEKADGLKDAVSRGEGAPEYDGAPGDEAESVPRVPGSYTLVNTAEALAAMAKDLAGHKILAVDTETTGLDNSTAGLVGLCLSAQGHTGYYVAIGHDEGPNLPLAEAQRVLMPVLSDPARLLVMHNARYDVPILERHGLLPSGWDAPGKLADTMIAAFLCNSGSRELSLDDLALSRFRHTMIPITDVIGKGKNQKNFREVPQAQACEYGAEDADYTLQLWGHYRKELADKAQETPFRELEMPLLPVLLAMEARGILVDKDKLRALSGEMKKEIDRLESEIHGLAGKAFNIASPMQLQQVLFVDLGLPAGKKTKTGYSTDAGVLERLADAHPIVAAILEYREVAKLRSTYAETLPDLIRPTTGRVHTTYSQVIAATGRLSSINPNLQNIPIRTELGRKIRGCFEAAPGKVLLCADYSQIELRMLAHLSGDEALRQAYREGLDIHARTAAALYGVLEDDVTADMRRAAKVVNFGVLYGMGAHRLAGQLKIPYAEAKKFIDNYFATYARVDAYIAETVLEGRKRGYVETLSGRRRYLPELLSDNRVFRENAERIAANTPIQGSAADLIKIAMIRIHEKLKDGKLPCSMLLQVHDELVFEVEESAVQEAAALVKREMEGAMTLSIPLIAEVGWGKTWVEAK